MQSDTFQKFQTRTKTQNFPPFLSIHRYPGVAETGACAATKHVADFEEARIKNPILELWNAKPARGRRGASSGKKNRTRPSPGLRSLGQGRRRFPPPFRARKVGPWAIGRGIFQRALYYITRAFIARPGQR